ncbi:MAG: metalloregulator ArsR/SmtB family transcription factor [Planctomycetota bacterium]
MSPAPVFAALGDSTRLQLVARLGGGQQLSIAQLTEGLKLTRQGVTKHLHVLQRAGLVSYERVGRERQYQLEPDSIAQAKDYLSRASAQWDEAIERLTDAVEREHPAGRNSPASMPDAVDHAANPPT